MLKLNPGERAKTTIDVERGYLVSVVGSGSTVVKYMDPCGKHPAGSWYVESDLPLTVVVEQYDGKRKTLRFTSKE